MRLKVAALCTLLVLITSPIIAEPDDRVKQATDLIIKLCIAGGDQTIEVRKKGDSIEVAGKNNSVQIDRIESAGLIGGISKELTALSAQQASEARACTQKYLRDLVDLILKDPPKLKDEPRRVRATPLHLEVLFDPEKLWSGRGIWQDNQNYCKELLEFLSASDEPDNFFYENGGKVSLKTSDCCSLKRSKAIIL